MNKVYCYDVTVSPAHCADKNIMRFKSFNRRTVKKYLEDNLISYDRIFEPYERPENGETYLDITHLNIPFKK